MVLERYIYVQAPLYILYVTSDFGKRAGFYVNMNQIFPKGMLAAITLVKDVVRREMLRSEPGVNWSFTLVQWPSLPYQRQGGVLVVEAEALKVRPKLALFVLSMCFLHSRQSGEQCLGKKSPCRLYVRGTGCGGPAANRGWAHLLRTASARTGNGCLSPIRRTL